MATRRSTARRRTEKRSVRERAAQLLARAGSASQLLATVAIIALLGMLGARGIALLYAQPVTHITVTGNLDGDHHDAVRATVAARIDRGLLALDLPALRDELEQLPWVYRATLRRQFPGTLEIAVVEQRPIARWGDTAFLNHEARVIDVADAQRWNALPLIRGPEGSQQRLMAHYRRLQEQLRPLELAPVSLQEDAFGQLTAVLDGDIELVLGDRDHFAARVDGFLTLWRRELRGAPARVTRVDLRYAGGAAVAFEDTPQIAALGTDNESR